jgi:simple sugar transport system ATP-binding protein
MVRGPRRVTATVETTAASPDAAVVEVIGVRKRFGATLAVDGVDLALRCGEVFGLVGTNGAGKSTLIRILSGAVRPDAGEVLVAGSPILLGDPAASRRAGIQAVQQEIGAGILPGHSVAENLALDRLADRSTGLLYRRRALLRAAAAIAEPLELQLDLDASVDDLGASDRQQILLARALSREPRLLILDEPTSALSARETERLFSAVRRLVAHGVTVLYISHRLAEVAGIADRVGVLREGRLVRTLEPPFSAQAIGTAMLGHAPAARPEGIPSRGETVVTIAGLHLRPEGHPIDLELLAGEVVGLLGLVGAGKSALLEGLFGARPLPAGQVSLDGSAYRPASTRDAIRRGVYLVPEDRARHGLLASWSIGENLSLPFLDRFRRSALLSRHLERLNATAVIDRLAIVARGPSAPVAELSGGNQQKVVVGRWLLPEARLLLLDEPFRGIDLGARGEIVARIRAAAPGRAVLVASSDVDELLEIADRIVVLCDGAVAHDAAAGSLQREGYAALAAAEIGVAA